MIGRQRAIEGASAWLILGGMIGVIASLAGGKIPLSLLSGATALVGAVAPVISMAMEDRRPGKTPHGLIS
jgi:hypothetical protein